MKNKASRDCMQYSPVQTFFGPGTHTIERLVKWLGCVWQAQGTLVDFLQVEE